MRRAEAVTGLVPATRRGGDFVDEILVGPGVGKNVIDGSDQRQIHEEENVPSPAPIPVTPESSSPSPQTSEKGLFSGIANPALDKICNERSSHRGLINQQDIGIMISRVAHAFENFSRIIADLSETAPPPEPDRPDVTPDFVDEILFPPNKTIGEKENTGDSWITDLSEIQNELEEARRNATVTVLPGAQKSSGKENPLEDFERFGLVLAKATIQFGDMISRLVTPEVRKMKEIRVRDMRQHSRH